MIRTKQRLVKAYFKSLILKYCKFAPEINLEIYFKDHLDKPTTLGLTDFVVTSFYDKENKETTTIYGYRVGFLKYYEDKDELMDTIVHEFTHLYLSLKQQNKHSCSSKAFKEQFKYFDELEYKERQKLLQEQNNK